MILDDDQIDPIAMADEESGEESVSGSNPAPGSDADTGEMVKEYGGKDPDPDMDNPQELNSALEVDEAEKANT